MNIKSVCNLKIYIFVTTTEAQLCVCIHLLTHHLQQVHCIHFFVDGTFPSNIPQAYYLHSVWFFCIDKQKKTLTTMCPSHI